MNVNLLDFLSPDFLILTSSNVLGSRAKGLINSNTNLKFYYLDQIIRDKVFIEPIWEFTEEIYNLYIRNKPPILTSTINKKLLKDNILKELLYPLDRFETIYTQYPKPETYSLNSFIKFVELEEMFANIYYDKIDDPNSEWYSLFENEQVKFIKDLRSDKNEDLYKIEKYKDHIISNFMEFEDQILVLLKNESSISNDLLFKKYILILFNKVNFKFKNIIDLYLYKTYLWSLEE